MRKVEVRKLKVEGGARLAHDGSGAHCASWHIAHPFCVPEGHRKLAGGEASPRAGTTGPSAKIEPAPAGAMESVHARGSSTPAGVRSVFDLFRWFRSFLASPPANFQCPSGTRRICQPKGLRQASPGQRPGSPIERATALKGRGNGCAVSRPFRANDGFQIVPRALPWAGLFQPFGLADLSRPGGTLEISRW